MVETSEFYGLGLIGTSVDGCGWVLMLMSGVLLQARDGYVIFVLDMIGAALGMET
jgi:hypothetical protein